MVRARRIQGGRADTVVKLRPVVPAELPRDIRRSPAFNVEVDVLAKYVERLLGATAVASRDDRLRALLGS